MKRSSKLLLLDGMPPPSGVDCVPYVICTGPRDPQEREGAAIALYLRRGGPVLSFWVNGDFTLAVGDPKDTFLPLVSGYAAYELDQVIQFEYGSWNSAQTYGLMAILGLKPVGPMGLPTLDPTADPPPVVHIPPPAPPKLLQKAIYVNNVDRNGAIWGYEITGDTTCNIFYGAGGSKPVVKHKSYKSAHQMLTDLNRRVHEKTVKGNYTPA